MADINKLKMGEETPSSIMLDKVHTKPDNEFALSYLKWANDGGGYWCHGLTILPITSWGMYTWPWDMGVPSGALKDKNDGFSKWGYIYDGVSKNLTSGINTNFPDNIEISSIGIGIMSDTGNATSPSGDEYLEFEHDSGVITVTFKDDRFKEYTYEPRTYLDNPCSSWDPDTRTITIYRTPVKDKYAVGKFILKETTRANKLTEARGLLVPALKADVFGLQQYTQVYKYPKELSSIECWDMYMNGESVYHKDKTFENCLKKYDYALPLSYKLYDSNFTSSPEVEWSTPIKFKVSSIPEDKVVIYNLLNTTETYYDIDSHKYTIKVSGIPEGAVVKAIREFTNLYEDAKYTTLISNKEVILANGINEIPEISKTLYHKPDTTSSYSSCKITIEYSGTLEAPIKFEFVPEYTDNTIMTLRPGSKDSTIAVPTITDIADYMNRLSFESFKPSDVKFLDVIKEWYSNNPAPSYPFYLGNLFREVNNLGDITIRLSSSQATHFSGEDNFSHTPLDSLTFIQEDSDCHITSPQRLLRACKAKVINIQLANNDGYLCGAVSVVDAFSCIGPTTYPERFIKWNEHRSNSQIYGELSTLAHYAFNNTSLVDIPSFPGSEDDNTLVVCGNAERLLYSDSIKTFGPIIDLGLVSPNNASDFLTTTSKITYLRLKNLNHGDWHFDGTYYNSIKHGSLANLDQESVTYLFNHLSDLRSYTGESMNDVNLSFLSYNNSGGYIWSADRVQLYNGSSFTTTSPVQIEKLNIALSPGDTVQFVEWVGSTPTVLNEWTANTTNATVSCNSSNKKGFIASVTEGSYAILTIVNGYNRRNSIVPSAKLYCPSQWEDKITDEMVTAANTKGWSIYIGGILKTI